MMEPTTFNVAYRALVDIRDSGRTAKAQTAASVRAQEALDAISEIWYRDAKPEARDSQGPIIRITQMRSV